ncbi:MAG: penicillin-binding protein activator [bacterium]
MPLIKRLIRVPLILLPLLIFNGCSDLQGVIRSSEPEGRTELIAEAEKLLKKADEKKSPQREYHQLSAADMLARAGNHTDAARTLASIDIAQLDFARHLQFNRLYTSVAQNLDEYLLVLKLTTDLLLEQNWGQVPPALQNDILSDRADIQALLGLEAESIETFQRLYRATNDRSQRKVINQNIWSGLNRLSSDELLTGAARTEDATLTQWYDLARAWRQHHGDLPRQIDTMRQWLTAHPGHPVRINTPESLKLLLSFNNLTPNQVAVLLPDSGNLKAAGRAIQRGFAANWLESTGKSAGVGSVEFYDTAATTDIATIYQQAVDDGADLIIGPLSRDDVATLNALDSLSVPTIALNYLGAEAKPGANLFQLGLSTTDEAEQIASQARIDGHRKALVVAPQTRWAEKTVDAFRRAWINAGGELEQLPPYALSQNDFAPMMSDAMHIHQSESRAGRLEKILGKNLHFTPRRRQDVDMIFLVAYPDQARQINPTFAYVYASDVPVYATSHVYNGSTSRSGIQDLNGIIFVTMPWTLPDTIATALRPDNSISPAYRQLYALGMDAYLIHQWLPLLQAGSEISIPGATGQLRLNAAGEVTREYPWATFTNGAVKKLPRSQTKTPDGD